ncbi:hypothetical protein QUB10_21390 [Microcoleus sp. B5-D4]|uniref:hypothetical protein n=1 Tax=unclassified Microcoleus TaxID=2642155 RepID=UPI002FD18757
MLKTIKASYPECPIVMFTNTLIENLLEYSHLSKANFALKAVSLHLIVARSRN